VHFNDVAYLDLIPKVRPAEKISSQFRMQRLTDFYYGWGAAAADFNHDGILDLVSGARIYYGPDYTRSTEIYPAFTTNPSDAYTRDCWMEFSSDFTGDGWPDVITASFAGSLNGVISAGTPGVYLYVNPKGESRRWAKHLVVPEFSTEIAVLRDIDGDGKPSWSTAPQGICVMRSLIRPTRPGSGSCIRFRRKAYRPRMESELGTSTETGAWIL
jgi:hypothetical protein